MKLALMIVGSVMAVVPWGIMIGFKGTLVQIIGLIIQVAVVLPFLSRK